MLCIVSAYEYIARTRADRRSGSSSSPTHGFTVVVGLGRRRPPGWAAAPGRMLAPPPQCGRGQLPLRARAVCLSALFLACSVFFLGSLLERRQTAGLATGAAPDVDAARSAGRPAAAAAHAVAVIADVVAVDPVKSTITLRGPAGREVELKIRNQDHFTVVKKGDQVEAVYSEAVALAVTPTPNSVKR